MASLNNTKKRTDEERLAAQKAKNPTNIDRARSLAKEYSNPYKFSNTVTVKKTVTNDKWYSGNKPTARETVARMYQVADGDEKRYQELAAMFDAESAVIGSPIYNPYMQATNYKAIDGLTELGFDLSGGVTSKWLTDNMGLLNGARYTATGTDPAAPTKSSTPAQDAAYWFNTLLKAEERTRAAETEYAQLAEDVKYWADRGYSDEEIMKRVRADFSSKYKTLNAMDEDRLLGDATLLNRKVNYNGDDTIYGMIWAARNDGSSGDYFADSVKYTMKQGKQYVPDANSEAARDPSNKDGYNPYAQGSTMHDLNMKYGVQTVDTDWLEANRSMLSDPEQADDWQKYYQANETTAEAKAELEALIGEDGFIQQRLNMGDSADEIMGKLEQRLKKEYPTLYKMEHYREMGSYIDLTEAVDFTMPNLRRQVESMVAERDAANAAEAEQDERSGFLEGASKVVTSVGQALTGAKNWITGESGALEDVVDAQKGEDMADLQEIARNYARDTFGVEITGELKPHEEAALKDAIGKANKANMPRATQEAIDEANVAAAALQDIFSGILADKSRLAVADEAAPEPEETKADYKGSIAYSSVLGASDIQQPREGMVDMQAELTVATGKQEAAVQPGKADKNSPEATAYIQMLQGGEWDPAVYTWALRNSTNRRGIEVELMDGIADIMSGRLRAEDAGLAGSWWRQHAYLVNGRPQGQTGIAILDSGSGQMPQVVTEDARMDAALKANKQALDLGAITEAEHIENLIELGGTADIVNGVAAGDAERVEQVYAKYPQQADRVAAVQAACEAAIESTNAEQEEALQAIQNITNGILDAWHSGTELGENEQAVIDAVFSSDITAVAKNDAGYQAASAYLKEAMSMENLLRGGMTFTTGSVDTDMLMDHADLQQTGALAYGQGVTSLAQARLDQEMQIAAAYGMGLDEYYQAYPERARTGEQLLAEAEAEYNAVWNEFGRTISGLLEANESMDPAEAAEEPASMVAPEDSLTFRQSAELGVAASLAAADSSMAKTINFLLYGGLTSEESKDMLRRQYNYDPAAARAGFEEYLATLPEDSDEYRDLSAKLETYTDIFDIGMTVDQMKSESKVQGYEQDQQAIMGAVEQYGTKGDKDAFKIVQSISSSTMQMATAMIAQGAGVGGFASQLIASAAEGGAKAYDLNQQTGNYGAAALAAGAFTMANSAMEYFMELGYKENRVLSMAKAKMYKQALAKMGNEAPKALADVAMKGAYIVATKGAEMAANAAGEGATEGMQSLVESVITNSALNLTGARTGAILTGEDAKQVVESAVMGAITSPVLGAMVGGASSGYTGIMEAPFVDQVGEMITAAEAQLEADYEGRIINEAINLESNYQAAKDAGVELEALASSSEYAAAQQARTAEVQAQQAEVEAQTRLQQVNAEADAVKAQLADLNQQMLQSDEFSEDMRKQMLALADRMLEFPGAIADAEAQLKGAQKQRQQATKAREQAEIYVQAQYDGIMRKAKTAARQKVIEELFAGENEQARAAEEAYLSKVAELTEAKNALRSAKADMEMFAAGSARSENARSLYYAAKEEVDALTDEVRQLKAEADAARENAVTASQISDEDLGMYDEYMEGEAFASAEQAAAEAKADPGNAQKQQLAAVTAAERDAAAAQRELTSSTPDIERRMKMMDPDQRAAARNEYWEKTRKVKEAGEAARKARAEYDRSYTPKGRLQAAIENMRKYSTADLQDADGEYYADAWQAYNELKAATEQANADSAVDNLARALESGQTEEIVQAVKAVDENVSRNNTAPASISPETVNDFTEESAKNKAKMPFLNAHRDGLREHALAMADIILDDVSNSSKAERIFNWNTGNGQGGTPEVTGYKRVTTDLIAKYMDAYKWGWGEKGISGYLNRFINAIRDGKDIPNTTNMKRIEMMVDEALSEGYEGFDEYWEPDEEYIVRKGEATGEKYNIPTRKVGSSLYDRYGVGSPVTKALIQEVKARSEHLDDSMKTADGRYVLEIGNKFVYTDGNSENPNITEVVTRGYPKQYSDETLEDYLKETVYHAHDEEVDTDGVWEALYSIFESHYGDRNAVRRYGARVSQADNGRTDGRTGGAAGADAGRGTSEISYKKDVRAWRDTGEDWGDHRTPGRTGQVTTADRNPVEILSDLTRSIRVGLNLGSNATPGGGRMRSAVQGFYSARANAITLRTNAVGDLTVGLHEFGHAVQERMNNLHANQQLLNNMPQGVRNAYSARELDGEAVAEFVVDYIFNRDEAVRMAGDQFVQDFEDMLSADPTLDRAITQASTQVELWNNADTGSKIGATIKDGNDPRRGQIGNWLQRTARKIETAVADMAAPAELVSRDFRQRALYSMHARQRADVSLTRFLIDPQGRNIGQSLAERFYRAGVNERDQAEVSRYALARHALDRRMQGRDVFNEAEFPTSELEEYVADIEANRPDIVAGADAMVSFWKDYMDAWWVNTGMIDGDAVARMRAMYPNYVPTFRVVGENFNQYGGRGSRFQVRSAVRGGSSLEVIDPLVSIVKMTQQMTNTVTQNELMRAFHAEMQQGGLGEIAERVPQEMVLRRTDTSALQTTLDAINASGSVDPALMGDAYAEMLNLQERWYGTGQNYGANVVSGVDADGNRFFYRIKDKGLYDLLSGANSSKVIVPRWMRNAKNVFTKLTTGSNPLFAVKNAQRDIQSSTNTGTHSLTYAGGMRRWMGAMREIVTNNQTYQDWLAMGGGEHTRYNTELNGADAGSVSRDLSSSLFRGRATRSGRFKTRSTAIENIANLVTWEKFNNAIENASRYMEYRYGRHDLTTEEGRREAFMASQDVTTNFGTHGANAVIQNIAAIVPFMNATIQGLNKDVHLVRDLFSEDANVRRRAVPKVAKTITNTALTAALQYALLQAFGGSEDDEDYALLSQDMRTGNLIVPIPKGAMEVLGDAIGFDKPYVRIPIAQGPVIQGLYAVTLDMIANAADYSPMEVDLMHAAKSVLVNSVPDGTVFQAAVDAQNNRTWYGGEIESEYMRQNSLENRYDSDTPQAVIQLGDWLNVSPAKLNYLLEQYTGFAGKLLMPLISAGRLDGNMSLSNSAENLLYSVLKNYTIDPVSSNDLSRNYSAAKETISEIIRDGKAGKPMNNIAYSADGYEAYEAAVSLQAEFDALDDEISGHWVDYNEIKASNLSDGEKATRMRDIRKNYIIPLQEEANALYQEYKMKYIDADALAIHIVNELSLGNQRPTY